jgi:hypothetical protein
MNTNNNDAKHNKQISPNQVSAQLPLIRKPIYPDRDGLVCNNRNVHEYTPYIIGDTNIIDEEWWNSLSSQCQDMIKSRTNKSAGDQEAFSSNFILSKVQIPHEFQFDNSEKFLGTIYRAYIDSFDYNMWYPYIKNLQNCPKDIIMLEITLELKTLFVKLYEKQDSWNNHVDDPHLSKFYNELKSKINYDNEYFLRMSSTSGKNEESVKIFTNADDILNHITTIKLFVDQEYKRRDKESYIILMPWNYKIESRYEFRIFVVNNILTGVSQQNRYDLYNYTTEELEMIEMALNNISFLKLCPYSTYVGDVFVDIETKQCQDSPLEGVPVFRPID